MGLFSALFGGVKIDRTIEVNKASATAGLKIIYGRRKVEPVSVYKCVSRDNMPVSGTYDHADIPVSTKYDERRKNYDWLYRVDVWGLGEISAIEKIWVEGEYSHSERYQKRPYFRAHSMFGRKNQTAITEFAAISGSKWSSAHRGREISYSINRFYNSKKKPQFRSEPKVEALIKGIAVYDPRDPGQSIQDPSTWKYSENKVLVALNYLMASYGQGVKASEIDLDSWKNAADICDQTVITIPDVLVNNTGQIYHNYLDRNSGQFVDVGINQPWPNYREEQVQGQTTMQRYESHIAIDPKNATVENMRDLLGGFGWSMPWSNGQYKLIIEEAVTQSVASFDENDIMGGWKIAFSNRKNRLNRMTIEFANRNKNFEQDVASWPQAQSDIHLDFLAEDQGEDLHSRETATSISDHYQAQAYAEYLVRKSRVKMRIKGLKLGPRAIVLDPGDVIDLTDHERGFDKKYFIVEAISFGEDLIPSVNLVEYDPAVYGATVSQEPNNLPAQEVRVWDDPAPISGLTATAFHDKNGDGTTINGFDLQWQAPENTAGLDYIDISWRTYDPTNIGLDEDDQTPFTESFQVPIDSQSARIKGLKDNENYDIRLSYKTMLGQISDSTVISKELGDAATEIITNYDNIIDAPTNIDELDPDAGQDINTANLGPVVSRQGLRWGFGNGTSQGWTAHNGTLFTSAQSIYLENTTNPDLGMRSPNLSFSGADNMAVRVRIRSIGQDVVANPVLYYKTTIHNENASYRREYGNITFKAGKWRGLIFDMRDLTAGGDDWLNSIITQIRLDPANKAGVKFQIDGIVIGYFGSADVTAENTAADTSRVNGVLADIVESRAETGYRLTINDTAYKIDKSSIDGVEIASALSEGVNISTVKNWGFAGFDLTQAGTSTKLHKDSLFDVDLAEAKIGTNTTLATVKDHSTKGYGLTINDITAKLHTSSIDGVEIASALSDGVNISTVKNWGFAGFDLTQAGTASKIHKDSLFEVDLSDAKVGTVTKLANVKNDAQLGRELTEDNATQLDPSSIAGLDVVLGQTQLAGDLRLTATGDASPGSTNHAFQIGYSTGFNLIADVNEIMARVNGATSPLYLNNDGGAVWFGSNAQGFLKYELGHLEVGAQNATAEGGQLTLRGASTYNDLYIDNNQGHFRVIRNGQENLNVGFNAGRTRIRSDHGHVDIGPNNASYCHFYTDRPQYYFDKRVFAETSLNVYGTSSYLDANYLNVANMRLGNRLLKYYGGWANEPETDILYGGYSASVGDYMILRQAGNNVAGGRDGLIVSDGGGFAYGKGSNAVGGVDNADAANPFTETLFRVDRLGRITAGRSGNNTSNILTLQSLYDNYITFERNGNLASSWKAGLDNTDSKFEITYGETLFGADPEFTLSTAGDAWFKASLSFNGDLRVQGKRVLSQTTDAWLRINQDSDFSSGIYTGSSKFRTDHKLEVGNNGSAFYADINGYGYFAADLAVGDDLTVRGQHITHFSPDDVIPYRNVYQRQSGGFTTAFWMEVNRWYTEDSAGADINAATYGVWTSDRTAGSVDAYHRYYAMKDGVYDESFRILQDYVHALGRMQADGGFNAGYAAGTEFGDDNLVRPTNASAWLNVKGGTGRAKMALGNDRINIASGADDIYFNTDAVNSTNSGNRIFTLFNGGVGIAQLSGTQPAYELHETDRGSSEDLGRIVRAGDVYIQNETQGVRFSGVGGADLLGVFQVRRSGIYQDILYNGYTGTASLAGDMTIAGNLIPDSLTFNHPTSGGVTVAWEDNYLRYRFGGTSTPQGLRIDNYDIPSVTLNRHSESDFAKGVITPHLLLPDGNTKLHEGNGNSLRVTTASGYVDIGAQNTGYCHLSTDRPKFYMNQELDVTARVRVYNTQTYLENGLLHVDSTGNAGVIVNADSDNVNENEHPFLLLKQDGGAVQGQISLDESNDLVIDLMGNAGTQLVFKANGVEVGRMDRTGIVTCKDFVAKG